MTKRIYMNEFDRTAVTYYRASLPAAFCKDDLAKEGIEIVASEYFSTEDDFDAYIFQRTIKSMFLPLLEDLKARGKKIVYGGDDDIHHIPPWNPAHHYFDDVQKDITAWTIDLCDHLIVSTEPLAHSMNRMEKTVVLPNLIDASIYSEPKRPAENGPTRVLWAGSIHHERDLTEVVPAIERILAEREDVQFLFFGDLPVAFQDWARLHGSNMAVMVPHKRLKGKVGYIPGVPPAEYVPTLEDLQPQITMAPLTDNLFNDSKSNIKFLEMTLAGAPVIATNLPPYQCIYNAVDGLLVEPGDANGWYEAITRLVDNKSEREWLSGNARQVVMKDWSWQHSPLKEKWLEFFRRLV